MTTKLICLIALLVICTPAFADPPADLKMPTADQARAARKAAIQAQKETEVKEHQERHNRAWRSIKNQLEFTGWANVDMIDEDDGFVEEVKAYFTVRGFIVDTRKDPGFITIFVEPSKQEG